VAGLAQVIAPVALAAAAAVSHPMCLALLYIKVYLKVPLPQVVVKEQCTGLLPHLQLQQHLAPCGGPSAAPQVAAVQHPVLAPLPVVAPQRQLWSDGIPALAAGGLATAAA
jgi:hypothetical protein